MKREFKPGKATKAILAACKMPPTKHSTSEPFDVRNSEVVDWLAQQPAIRLAMFDHYRDKGCIVFDTETGTWKGIDS